MHVGTATTAMIEEAVVHPTEIPIVHFCPTTFAGAAAQIVLFAAALAFTSLPVMHGFTAYLAATARRVRLVLGLIAADTFTFIPTVADRMAFATGAMLIQIMKFLAANFAGTAFHLVWCSLCKTTAQTLSFGFAIGLNTFGKRWKLVFGELNLFKSTPTAYPQGYTFFA